METDVVDEATIAWGILFETDVITDTFCANDCIANFNLSSTKSIIAYHHRNLNTPTIPKLVTQS